METKSGWNPLVILLSFSIVLFLIFLISTGAYFLASGSHSSKSKTNPFSNDALIGVLEVKGVIMDAKKTLKHLHQFEEDSKIKAVVLRINSPGGAVAPSQEIYEAIKKFPKPLVASMGSVAASGGFYIAMGAKKIFANPGTITGSIGVIMQFMNLKKLLDWAKVEPYVVKTGKFKDIGSVNRDMSPDEKALLQGMVDDVLSQFKLAISEGRKLPPEDVTAIADGRIFSGQQAKTLKLVDELGTLEDAVNDAGKLAKVTGKPKAVYPSVQKGRLLELLMGDDEDDGEAESSQSSLASTLQQIVVGLRGLQASAPAQGLESPGVYYLWHGPRF